MTQITKKICIFLLILLILEIGLFAGWRWFRTRDTGRLEGSHLQTRPEIPETKAEPEETSFTEPTTHPTDCEETIPEETISEETIPKQTQLVTFTIDQVPQYYQNDYPDTRYLTTNIATGGSGVTALAMVASYLTDHYYYPDEVADFVAPFMGSHYERLQYGADLMQLSWKRAANVHEVFNAVKEGKVAINLTGSKSPFGESNHYVVLTGYNDDGTIRVLDPDRNHYSRGGLNTHLETGFKEGYLVSGFQGGWIFDKSAMPEDPFIYEPEPPAEVSRYTNVELADWEKDLLAKLIYMEGQSEPFEGQQAIAEVVLNRLVSSKFPDSIHNIIHAQGQFPSVEYLYMAKPDYTQYEAIEHALNGPYVLPMDVVFYAKFSVNKNVWGTIGAHTFCYSY